MCGPHVHVEGDRGNWTVVRRAYEDDLIGRASFLCVHEAMRFADECGAHEDAHEYALTIERTV